MIEIIAIAIGMFLLAGICLFIADRFSDSVFITTPMTALSALCIAIVIVIAAVVICHYCNTLGLNIGN